MISLMKKAAILVAVVLMASCRLRTGPSEEPTKRGLGVSLPTGAVELREDGGYGYFKLGTRYYGVARWSNTYGDVASIFEVDRAVAEGSQRRDDGR